MTTWRTLNSSETGRSTLATVESARRPRTARTLRSGFLAAAQRFPEREALVVGAARLTYRELETRARRLAATFERHDPDGGCLTAVLGHRHPTAFAGILGALIRGHGYVPLNPSFPSSRTCAMLARSRCRCVVVDPTAIGVLGAVLQGVEDPLVVLVPDLRDVSPWSETNPRHTILGARDLARAEEARVLDVDPTRIAYLMFTSGITGSSPTSVMVSHRNVVAFLDAALERYSITEEARLSQTFDLTLDLSVFDMFCAWERGPAYACRRRNRRSLWTGTFGARTSPCGSAHRPRWC